MAGKIDEPKGVLIKSKAKRLYAKRLPTSAWGWPRFAATLGNWSNDGNPNGLARVLGRELGP